MVRCFDIITPAPSKHETYRRSSKTNENSTCQKSAAAIETGRPSQFHRVQPHAAISWQKRKPAQISGFFIFCSSDFQLCYFDLAYNEKNIVGTARRIDQVGSLVANMDKQKAEPPASKLGTTLLKRELN